MSRLSELIGQAKRENPELGAELEKEVRHLQERRSFGLNFERHQPESVDLYGRPVRKGDKVRMLPPRGELTSPDDRLWIVTGARMEDGKRICQLRLKDNRVEETAEYPIEDLVVVAESNDVIYPGLVSTGRIERGGDKPFHTVINAENLHALKLLMYTHRGKIDCIYIDPPYNTGSEGWIYNDKYVAGDDSYKHSKWLAFMERRLAIAKDLLAETGIVIVAVGDDEHHRLRMLLDQIFGPQNFISSLVWSGGRKNDSRYVSNGADYMLVYAASEATLAERQVRWREPRPSINVILDAARSAWLEAKGNADQATVIFRRWWGALPADHPAISSRHYNRIDDVARPGLPYFAGDLRSPNPRPNLQYPILHPKTRKPVNMHPNGWTYARDRMHSLVEAGRIRFGPDETTRPTLKRFIDEGAGQVPLESFYLDRRAASKHLEDIMGGPGTFPNPKDHTVLVRWLGMMCPSDGVVLDFFAGSGTTAEAVMILNQQDGGRRQTILVTNNEVRVADARRMRRDGLLPRDVDWESTGVYESVTRPRVSTLITGTRRDGSEFSRGLRENAEFFAMTYETPTVVAGRSAFGAVAPLLWMRAGGSGRCIDNLAAGWGVTSAYGVIEDLNRIDDFVAALEASPQAVCAFVVTDDDRQFAAACEALPDRIEPVRLYESYLRNFQIDAQRSAR